MHICVWMHMPVCTHRDQERVVSVMSITLLLVPLQGLSLSLGLGQWPANSRNLLAPVPYSTGVTAIHGQPSILYLRV